MKWSLHARLALSASILMVGFLGLTGVTLDRAFRSSSEQAMRDRLLGQIYALLAATQDDAGGGLRLPDLLPDPRFNQPDSGFYAQVAGEDFAWRSASITGGLPPFQRQEQPGHYSFQQLGGPGGEGLYSLSFGVAWERFDGGEQLYTFSVAQGMGPFYREIGEYRRTLWLWLGGVVVVLLMAQAGVLAWGLKPLRKVARDLQRVEEGEQEQLPGGYPREVEQLTENINSLIRHAQAREVRYRHAMDDLAHGLKTPLAVMQAAAEADDAELRSVMSEQTQRMSQMVTRQLGRATSSGRIHLARQVPLRPLIERLAAALRKVYREKEVELDLQVPASLRFQGDEGDLMEVLGNLLDNAWKYCASKVRVRAQAADAPRRLEFALEDDGSGVPDDAAVRVLQRGVRVDQTRPGHGIGLATASEIVRLYGGDLSVRRSPLGGACVALWLPLR